MKDRKDILETGMLERYLMGDLSMDEIEMVERAISSQPDLKRQLDLMEKDLELMAKENAVNPPDHIKQAVFRRINEDLDDKIKPLHRKPRGRTFTSIAASLAVLFLLSSFWLYQKMNGIEKDLQFVTEQNNLLKNENGDLVENYSELVKWYEVVNNSDTEKLIMKGNNLSPEAKAIGYLNHADKSVILNTTGLPKLSEDKDYQLWADVDGEMIDMGVIPRNMDMAIMKYIANAESLNITIEPAGGNDHPTVSQLITNVYLKRS